MHVFVEAGAKRVFATAIDWPGWARSGKTEDEAIDALLAYRPRYEAAIGRKVRAGAATVTARVPGDGNTDFGVPGDPPADSEPVDARQLARLVSILESCWSTFDSVATAARGKKLATGPRGGGRTLAKIVDHHDEALGAYVMKLGGDSRAPDLRGAFLEALEGRRRGDIEDTGPRGGARWTPRQAVRRAAWHALDHAWEIEDRS